MSNLRARYNTTRANCCMCGCALETSTGFPLGDIFVMDVKGKFYCFGCDSIFDLFDERIYELDEED